MVTAGAGLDRGDVIRRGGFSPQEVGGERTSRGRAVLSRSRQVPEIRERGETALARDSQPRPARLEVAPREDVRRVAPPRGRRRAAREELVAVGGDREARLRRRLPREDDQAHAGTTALIKS